MLCVPDLSFQDYLKKEKRHDWHTTSVACVGVLDSGGGGLGCTKHSKKKHIVLKQIAHFLLYSSINLAIMMCLSFRPCEKEV